MKPPGPDAATPPAGDALPERIEPPASPLGGAASSIASDLARSRAILESLPLLWFRLDAHGVFRDFHAPPELQAYVLMPPEHFIDHRLEEVLPPQVAELSRAALDEVLADGVSRRFDYALQLADGPRWFHCCMVRAGDDEVFAHVSDISAQKAAEDAMRRALAEAEAAASARTRFVATVSHEVRTPVSGILGMVELLKDTPLDDEQHSYLEMLQSASRTLLTVINDVLDFSKIEADHLEMDEVAFSPRDLVEGVAALLAERAHSKDLELTAYVDHAFPATVIGDPKRIEQVLTNLVSNAVKFTHDGSVVLRARVARRTRAGFLARFEVEDTGIGIRPEVQSAIFAPFVQADASTARRFGGTGLGLAISRRLVDLMDGAIRVTSEPGAGSCFTVDLPLTVPGGHRVRVATDIAQLRDRVAGRRALLVCSSPGLCEQLRHELTHAGVACDATHPSDARELFGSSRYDLVLVELGADLEPVEALVASWADALHTAAAGPDAPLLVALPHFGRREASALASRHPFDATVPAPPRQRDLLALLRRLAPPPEPDSAPTPADASP